MNDPRTAALADEATIATLRAALEKAEAFVNHVAEAATWPTPGIGCDARCKEATALRAALATVKEADHATD